MQRINPYLNFDGTCREAMTFYHQCLGGSLSVMTMKESGQPAPPGAEDRVMHARIESGGAILMASDTMLGKSPIEGNTVQLSIECEGAEELDRLYAALAAGGRSTMEPQDTFWGARFGMLIDKYGIRWMLNYQK